MTIDDLWLEAVSSERALSWVRAQNQQTDYALAKGSAFSNLQQQFLAFYNADSSEKTFASIAADGFAYRLLTDKNHPQGIWQRQAAKDYVAGENRWQTILDFADLNKAEGTNFRYGGFSRYKDSQQGILALSENGEDAVELREFNLHTGFVDGGFTLPKAKQSVSYVDAETILVCSPNGLGDDGLTDSGYARVVRLLQLGQPLSAAQIILRAQKKDLSVWAGRMASGDIIVCKSVDFYNHQTYFMRPSGVLETFNMPTDTGDIAGVNDTYVFIHLQNDWQVGGYTYKKGALVAALKDTITSDMPEVSLVTDGESSGVFENMAITKNGVYLCLMHNGIDCVYEAEVSGKQWFLRELSGLPENSQLGITGLSSMGSDELSNKLVVYANNPTTPQSQYLYGPQTGKLQLIVAQPERFDSQDIVVEQRFATSPDGVQVPYFVIGQKQALSKPSPTILYGYGGFKISLQPGYQAITGKFWLENGGVYVMACIRGGGEKGPNWHQAALKHNRQRAYDDFIAVSEALIADKVTSQKQLVIKGGSNGGLLVGAVMMQRPDLYAGMVCEVPLLDMLRFHTLLAGNSWMGEYGNPDVDADRRALTKYSPYHNIAKNAQYPELFITTSTHDDRVHPAHARRMVHKLQSYGHTVYYHEVENGGHTGGSQTPTEQAYNQAVIYSYLAKVTGIKL